MRSVFKRGERGATLVEFAMVSPVLFTLLFGVIEAGMMFNAWASVQHSAEMGARYAVTGRETCSSGGGSRFGCIISEAQSGVAHLHDASTNATVTARSWAYPTYVSKTEGSAGKQCDAVEIQVTYRYTTRTPIVSLIVPSVNLTGRQRFINEPFGACRTFS